MRIVHDKLPSSCQHINQRITAERAVLAITRGYAGANSDSAPQFARYKAHERSNSGKSCTVNFVVVDLNAKTLLKRRDELHDCHRVKFWNRPEKRRGWYEGSRTPLQT